MEFSLTEGQQDALKMVTDLMQHRGQVGILKGYAGTGKTTLLHFIADKFGPPIILAPTGKAALRVGEATGLTASTIHKWLYHPKENQYTGEMEFVRKGPNELVRPGNHLVVVDESSMVGRDVWNDLSEAASMIEANILLVGDTFQLAPVEMRADEPFSALKNIETPFEVQLTEITRQALDNPILRASMLMRESSDINQALNLLERVWSADFDDAVFDTHQRGQGVILVHKNETRHRLNEMVRARLGYTQELVRGEPLLVLRNIYAGVDRFNGEILTFGGWRHEPTKPSMVTDHWKKTSTPLSFGMAWADADEVMLSPEQVKGESTLVGDSTIQKASRREFERWFDNRTLEEKNSGAPIKPHLHANFGYALTCHKSQGSEWKEVLVLLEKSTKYWTHEGRRWAYTAITRARERVRFSVEKT